ncbi:MAG TPA: Pls/PosA family non-ribosomal peptide synthetase [Pseudonocardiaceae bacterium]|nr:Pls/PosA family non-ribosomal peptide synthetase [Pseudonocardiaceae bacterium]
MFQGGIIITTVNLDLAVSPATPADRVLVCEQAEHTIRWRPGERLDHLFADQCDRIRHSGVQHSGRLAVDAGENVLTYDQLDARANQLARYLLTQGARPGDRIALLFDEAVHSYVGMLAVLKINAAYVPLDVGFPPDRISYIVGDAGARMVLSLSHVRTRVAGLQDLRAELVFVDEVADLVAQHDMRRLTDVERGDPVDELAYIIYTSGSTGRPKGVAINHPSICNFVRVAAEVYGIQPEDRVYQGMTVAFDFSVEEIWVPWMVGATLVPKPGGSSLLGIDLHEFLTERRVTAMCCVPTLLATLDEDLPDLRFLLVSGEACPQDLIARWYQPGRRFLNVYGPTEATVTATWTSVHPDRPVTIGVPLPTYSTVILDPEDPRKALPHGAVGEIGIAGVGLAGGYVNRPDLTARAFIPDFLDIPDNISGRIYRTGDLGRVNDDGELEYHGRIDTQVKIRGYRIELTEIESVLLQVPGIAQAVVDTYEPEPGVVELVGYYSLRTDTTQVDSEQIYAQLRGRLPAYMVPAYLEYLDVIPMTTNDKADRKSLPAPTTRRGVATQHSHVAATTDTEQILADALASTLRLAQVSIDHHFFDDLGADSLLLAQFCTRVRKRTDLPPVSMKDVYLHPTIRSLASSLAAEVPAGAAPPVAAAPVAAPASTARYVLCGALQLLLFMGSVYFGALVLEGSFRWITSGAGLVDTWQRSLLFSAVSFPVLCAVPILAKWVLIGRWRPQEIPVWSLAYVRFWFVKILIRSNPMVLFVGSPLYVLYLRALGARIGRGVVIFSRTVPACADLLTIGDRTVIRKDASFTCYRAHAGRIQTGPVTLGDDVVVSEEVVLDIHTSMGDGAQIGHASSLNAGQAVPDGQCWHGTPAQRSDVDYRAVDPAPCGAFRRVFYSLMQLLNAVVLTAPLVIMVPLLAEFSWLAELIGPGHHATTTGAFYRDALVSSLVLFFGGMLIGLVFVVTVPRVLNLALKPDTVYPLYGFHFWIQRIIARTTNSRFFTFLFGDSSAIVHYLRALGYDLCRVEQTGSNFGMAIKHETPYLSVVGSGTMVSDGLSFINAHFSSTSFRVSRASIGPCSFLGNNIVYPSHSRTGDNCLLATKVMVPIDGQRREGVGLLGSPPFEIPRSVRRDGTFDALKSGGELRHRLSAKNRHNAVTIGLFLVVRWIYFFAVTLLALGAADLHYWLGELALAAAMVVTVPLSVAYFVLVDRAVTAFRTLQPRFCSIYDPYFWQHERFWKVPAMMYAKVFNGTPFKNMIWRLLGVRIGRRVFDDGCWLTERSLVSIGDDCTLNAGSTIQSHSLEDGTFKSDHITIGAGCTVGTNAFIHYGVMMGDGAVLEADSFLMKGEEIAPHARWQGNPAQEIRNADPLGPTTVTPAITAAPATTSAPRLGGESAAALLDVISRAPGS